MPYAAATAVLINLMHTAVAPQLPQILSLIKLPLQILQRSLLLLCQFNLLILLAIISAKAITNLDLTQDKKRASLNIGTDCIHNCRQIASRYKSDTGNTKKKEIVTITLI